MPTLTIDGKEVTVEPGSTLLQACEAAGAEIPRFCYHERLSIAGNCRMCLVEMEKSPKPVASCAMPAGDGMVIHTNTPQVKKSREGVMEFLLINHPLDCPICDQGGECDLQDQSVAYGRGSSRFEENKRAVKEKHMGPLIKTVMTRCIHCTRCIRFATEIAGVDELGAIGRGEHMEITTYLEKTLASELSANVIDLCPVGALTSKPYAFAARPWELKKTESIDVMDAMGSNIRVDSRSNQVMRALPRLHEDVNEEWISDKTRYAVDGLSRRRLDRPWVRRNGRLEEADWPTAFKAIAKGLEGIKGDALAGVVGDLQDMESMLALKDLFTDLDSARIESRQDGAGLDPSSPAGYRFNSRFTGVDEADVILLVGSNPRVEAPVLNARIRANVVDRGLPVLRVGAADDLTYRVDDLGDNISILSDIFEEISEVSKLLESAERAMIIVGMGALQHENGASVLGAARAIADKFGLITSDWNGFNVLQTAAARVGALDLDLACDGGIAEILADAEAGKLKAAILLGADEFDTGALKDVFTVYIGSHGDEGVRHADVILPGAAYTEKSGTYLNTEGRVQRTRRAVFPPGDGREDWTILRALADVLGTELGYDTLGELRTRLAIVAPQTSDLDEVAPAEWGEFGETGVLVEEGFKSAIDDFYLTNPIARASQTMAECVAARDGTLAEGTGTDG